MVLSNTSGALRKKSAPKPSKYRNKKCVSFGKSFDSQGERDRYYYLQDAERRGEIIDLECQVRFKIEFNGAHICDYIADFVYKKPAAPREIKLHNRDPINPAISTLIEQQFEKVIEDFKGVQTEVFKLKNKLMLAVNNVSIKIVTKPTEAI